MSCKHTHTHKSHTINIPTDEKGERGEKERNPGQNKSHIWANCMIHELNLTCCAVVFFFFLLSATLLFCPPHSFSTTFFHGHGYSFSWALRLKSKKISVDSSTKFNVQRFNIWLIQRITRNCKEKAKISEKKCGRGRGWILGQKRPYQKDNRNQVYRIWYVTAGLYRGIYPQVIQLKQKESS